MASAEVMRQALAYMRELIEQGIEFPDAAWKASRKYRVDQGRLETAYDDEYEE